MLADSVDVPTVAERFVGFDYVPGFPDKLVERISRCLLIQGSQQSPQLDLLLLREVAD